MNTTTVNPDGWPLPPVTPASEIGGQVYEFERGYNRITQANGWRPLGIPDFDPVAPAMCIHDILEHFPECGAAVHEEYLALGAAHYIRDLGGYFRSRDQRISNDLVKPAFGMLFSHINADRLPITPAPMVREAFDAVTPFTSDLEIQRTVRNARRFFVRQYTPDLVDEWLTMALPWMRIGFRRAAVRYAGLNVTQVSRLWSAAQREIESREPYVTSQSILALKIDPSNGWFRVDVR